MIKKGDRVLINSNPMTEAWGWDNKKGVVLGDDPKGFNPQIRSMRIDGTEGGVTEESGIHVEHLSLLKEDEND